MLPEASLGGQMPIPRRACAGQAARWRDELRRACVGPGRLPMDRLTLQMARFWRLHPGIRPPSAMDPAKVAGFELDSSVPPPGTRLPDPADGRQPAKSGHL